MKTPILSSILAATVIAGAGAAYADPFYQHTSLRAQPISYRRLAGPAGERPLWAMDLTPRKPLERPYGQVGTRPQADRVPTAVSYQLAPNGPVGSVGIVKMEASHAVDPTLLSNAVSTQLGAPSETVGAALAYNFR